MITPLSMIGTRYQTGQGGEVASAQGGLEWSEELGGC